MDKIDINNANTLLERMILKTFYNDLGEMVSDKLKEVMFGKEGVTVTYINGQRIRFTVELLDEEN